MKHCRVSNTNIDIDTRRNLFSHEMLFGTRSRFCMPIMLLFEGVLAPLSEFSRSGRKKSSVRGNRGSGDSSSWKVRASVQMTTEQNGLKHRVRELALLELPARAKSKHVAFYEPSDLDIFLPHRNPSVGFHSNLFSVQRPRPRPRRPHCHGKEGEEYHTCKERAPSLERQRQRERERQREGARERARRSHQSVDRPHGSTDGGAEQRMCETSHAAELCRRVLLLLLLRVRAHALRCVRKPRAAAERGLLAVFRRPERTERCVSRIHVRGGQGSQWMF